MSGGEGAGCGILDGREELALALVMKDNKPVHIMDCLLLMDPEKLKTDIVKQLSEQFPKPDVLKRMVDYVAKPSGPGGVGASSAGGGFGGVRSPVGSPDPKLNHMNDTERCLHALTVVPDSALRVGAMALVSSAEEDIAPIRTAVEQVLTACEWAMTTPELHTLLLEARAAGNALNLHRPDLQGAIVRVSSLPKLADLRCAVLFD